MDSELVQNFCAVTGAEPDIATSYLQVSDNNVEQAITLYFENGGQPLQGGGGSGAAATQTETGSASAAPVETEVRAPIAARRDVLVDSYGGGPGSIFESHYSGFSQFSARSGGAQSIFNQGVGSQGHVPFRDFAQEAAEISGEGSAASSRRSRLAELFKPPFDLIHRGNFSSARDAAQQAGKWVLVNIQDVSDFRCQALNRDVWRQQLVKEVVSQSFVFFQIAIDNPEGARLSNMYAVNTFPFIAAIDPKTGEMRRMFYRFASADEMLEDLAAFVAENPTRGAPAASSAPVPAAAASSYLHTGVHQMTEDEQLAAAIAASALETSTAHPDADAIRVDSDSEADSDYVNSDSYSDIHSISSNDSDDYGEDIDDDNDDGMDVDAVSEAHERLAAQHAANVAAQAQVQAQQEAQRAAEEEEEEAAAGLRPNAWYTALSSTVPAEPDLGPTVTRIQLRFPDGRRVVRRFAKSDPVKAIFQFLKATLPEAAAELPEVAFMGVRLADIADQSIEEAKLANASLVVDV
ncbi:UBX domain protein Ubx2 [Coemansia sp. Benny D115]|nr:UBX domain protein Ubx2 [Coemansia sp. Benny D115]